MMFRGMMAILLSVSCPVAGVHAQAAPPRPAAQGGFIDPDAPGAPDVTPPRRRAILVGIKTFSPPPPAATIAAPAPAIPATTTPIRQFGNLDTPCTGVDNLEHRLHDLHWKAAGINPAIPADDNEVFAFCDKPLASIRSLITSSIEDFTGKDDLLVIYLAGHGARIGPHNYFFDTNARLNLDKAVERYLANPDNTLFLNAAMDLETLIIDAAGMNYSGNIVLIVDTCRDDPIHKLIVTKLRGPPGSDRPAVTVLPPSLERPSSGIMIFYATTKGYKIVDNADKSGNSYLVGALLAKMQSGQPITQIIADAKAKVIADTMMLDERERQSPTVSETINRQSLCLSGCPVFAESRARPVQLAQAQTTTGQPTASDTASPVWATRMPPRLRKAPDRYRTFRFAEAGSPAIQRNVEIFWCMGPGQEEASRQAEALGLALASAPARDFAGPGTLLGRVRSTWLTPDENARPDNSARANVVRFDPGEPTPATFAEAIRRLSSFKLKGETARIPSTGPLPVYFCANAAPAVKAPAKVWMQAARENQRGVATAIAGTIEQQLPNATVAKKVQIIPASPEQTQVRYFSPAESQTAERVADALTPTLGERPKVVDLSKSEYASGATVGLTEVWLGKNVDPTTVADKIPVAAAR